jgi:hypothetical protein
MDPAVHEFVVGKDSKLSIIGHSSTSEVQPTLAGQTAVKIGHLIEGKGGGSFKIYMFNKGEEGGRGLKNDMEFPSGGWGRVLEFVM